jgi:hypothetical protein
VTEGTEALLQWVVWLALVAAAVLAIALLLAMALEKAK